MSFTTPVDIANRALQHCGVTRIATLTDSSKPARETAFAIDKIRRALLERSVWTFATRRAVLRKTTSTIETITFETYDAAATYPAGAVVTDTAGFLWISTVGSNLANTPGTGGVNPFWVPYFGPTVADVWASGGPYYPGDVVYKSATVYILTGFATATTADPASGAPWVVITDATVAASVNFAPVGYATSTGTTQRNVYKLPANYIRIAPQDPKAPAVTRLGVTAGMMYNDWEIENGFLFSADVSPIIFRFVADQTDVTAMHDLFCEVWAAQLGLEVAEPLTQNHGKLADIMGIYNRYLDMAKLTNAIEGGSTEDEVPEGGQPAQPRGGQQQGG